MKKSLVLLLLALLLCCLSPAFAEGSNQVLFSGSQVISFSWTSGPYCYTTNSGGSFDPALLGEGCTITIRYTGTEGAVYLALSQWDTNTWSQVDAPAVTVAEDGDWVSTFTWEQMKAARGSEDMLGINAIYAGTANSTEPVCVTEIAWHGPENAAVVTLETDTVSLYRGSLTGSGMDAWVTCLYTAHAGGDWDARQLNRDGALRITYTGPKGGIYLRLDSASGGTRWVRLDPNVSVENPDGTRTDTYTGMVVKNAYGTDLSRLDEIILYCGTDETVTLRSVEYVPGEEKPFNTGDGSWRCSTSGIAVVGDSIVQNASSFGDWNSILGRADCVNLGIGGQTSRHCLARIGTVADGSYDTLMLLVGINDIGSGISAEETAANQQAMAEAVWAANPDCRVITISVLPTTEAFYQGMQDRITAINSLLQAWAEEDGRVTYVDCYSVFLAENGYARPELLSDGLHPNLAGYRLMAEQLSPVLN